MSRRENGDGGGGGGAAMLLDTLRLELLNYVSGRNPLACIHRHNFVNFNNE